MKTTFIYALNDPRTGQSRYVGKADVPRRRYADHLRRCHTEETHKANWVCSLLTAGIAPVLEILDEVPAAEGYFWEIQWIRLYRMLGFGLVNGNEGGEGGSNPMAEVREKISASKRGKKRSPELCEKLRAANTGKKLTPEHCAKISAGNMGKKMPPRSPESIERNRFNNLGKHSGPRPPFSAEWCANISAGLTGKKDSDETREKKRLAALNSWAKRKACQ